MMRIAIRTDASLAIGSGHVMRCLTLASALRRAGHQVVFVCRKQAGDLIAYIGQRGFDTFILPMLPLPTLPPVSPVVATGLPYGHSHWLGVSEGDDFAECQPMLANYRPDWLIIDHYAIGRPWQQNAKHRLPQVKILVIDDLADRAHACDILLDQTMGRIAADYQGLVPPTCRLLLGARYALLREEFGKWRAVSLAKRQTKPSVHQPLNLLVNLGGVDANNITLAVLQALQAQTVIKNLALTVVMGKTAPHIDSVQAFAKTANFPCQVVVNADNMAQLMAAADIAIGAAGSTAWERCCLGLPTLLVILADNQRHVAASLVKQRAAVILTDATSLHADNISCQLSKAINDGLTQALPRLSAMQKAASLLVDGRGVQRVVNWMLDFDRGQGLAVRPAVVADSQQIWQWRNHEAIRQFMFDQNFIPWQQHCRWFERQLAAPHVTLLVFEVAGVPRGFINISQNSETVWLNAQAFAPLTTASWGFYLAPECPKGQGFGQMLGKLGLAYAFSKPKAPTQITAQVLATNLPSLALHKKLGFTQTTILPNHHPTSAGSVDVVEFCLNASECLF